MAKEVLGLPLSRIGQVKAYAFIPILLEGWAAWLKQRGGQGVGWLDYDKVEFFYPCLKLGKLAKEGGTNEVKDVSYKLLTISVMIRQYQWCFHRAKKETSC